ncbi:MAG: sugar phosphate isomerase/epimerase [Burkholderiales bacterium]|nr:sugar phosphate isomerase/epimerase [Burkholderiales bacterium]
MAVGAAGSGQGRPDIAAIDWPRDRSDGTKRLALGMHTGAFNTAYFSFPRTVEWARTHGLRNIECGFVDGVTWNHGLGYFPHVASWEDPRAIRELLDGHGVTLSQLDAAFPLSGREGPSVGVPYVRNALRWAALAGCPLVDTTDGLSRPEGISDEEALREMRTSYARIMETAERYGITVTIETHGHFTTNPELLQRMLDFVDTPRLQVTFDIGNVYIAGRDPCEFLARFIDRVAHVNVKDVTPELDHSGRGRLTGIGTSLSAIGEGRNAANIAECVRLLHAFGYCGAMSLECDAQGGSVMQRSLEWFRGVLNAEGYAHDGLPGGLL